MTEHKENVRVGAVEVITTHRIHDECAQGFEQYDHHGATVWVRSDLRGKHRDHCLCWSCDKMKPGQPDHCPIASALYANCVKFNLVTPVYECPEFVQATT